MRKGTVGLLSLPKGIWVEMFLISGKVRIIVEDKYSNIIKNNLRKNLVFVPELMLYFGLGFNIELPPYPNPMLERQSE